MLHNGARKELLLKYATYGEVALFHAAYEDALDENGLADEGGEGGF